MIMNNKYIGIGKAKFLAYLKKLSPYFPDKQKSWYSVSIDGEPAEIRIVFLHSSFLIVLFYLAVSRGFYLWIC
jgi:hypothetical protein